MQSTALVATHNHDCHQPTCLRLSFRLEAVRRRPHCIQLSVPSQHVSVQTEHTSFLSFATALPVPLCPPSTSITLRLLHKHNILATIPLTYSKLCSSLHHQFRTSHATIHVLAAPHTPELATLRATFRVSSRGILNAARLSVIGDCVVSLRYLCNGVWVQFYRSGTPHERHAGGELLSYGPEHGAHTHIRIEAFRMTKARIHLVASVDTTLQHLLKIDRQLPLLENFASKGFVKTRDAQVDKCTARVNLDVFLYARQPDTGLPLPLIETEAETEPKPSPQSIPPSMPMTAFDFKQASQMYDFRASGLRNFFRGLFGMRRRKKLEQAALMIARAVENDANTNHSNSKPQLRF